jgi:hypothetical protein
MSLNWLAKISKWFSGLALKSVKDFQDTLRQALRMMDSIRYFVTTLLYPAQVQIPKEFNRMLRRIGIVGLDLEIKAIFY